MQTFHVYEDIAARTGGEIYVGVVGPVRTGKSTFIKKFMEELILPLSEGAEKQRMTDELPQSASGKTVMTTEPKFVPERAAELKVKDALVKVRLIDCVGFPVEGASGFEEEGAPRLVNTPWSKTPLSFEDAAEEGTKRVICDHSTIAVLVTTDGSISDIPRSSYEEGEERAARELLAQKKPFVILLNCKDVSSARGLQAQLQEKYSVPVIAIDIENASAEQLCAALERILYEFPVCSIDVDLPDWACVLEGDSPLISEILEGIRAVAPKIEKMSDCALLDTLFVGSERLNTPTALQLDPATGKAKVSVQVKEGVFYSALSEQCGVEIGNDYALMSYVASLGEAKKLYDRAYQAFCDAKEYGYGIIPPEHDEMSLSEPKMTKKSGRYGVNLQADAPSYHIIRVDVTGEVRPALGSEEQSTAFLKELSESMEQNPEKAWNTNMFGKTLKQTLGEELYLKNRSMAENVQRKMRKTVTKIVNEGKGGVICILL